MTESEQVDEARKVVIQFKDRAKAPRDARETAQLLVDVDILMSELSVLSESLVVAKEATGRIVEGG